MNDEKLKCESLNHCWVRHHEWMVCADCGIVKRKDGKNKPCKGKVKIGVRKT